ncbi:MAG: PUR family DNA/RNA-binding protein [Verrucomicrobia bacterium]|nr:PUR family DNA/RNA-binding protein [Verrucomicrobiota bacterium]
MDSELLSERIQIERKQFFFDLKENPRGRFLKITEDVGGRRDTIIIPSTGLSDFKETIQKAIEADVQLGEVVLEQTA